ncbi:trehalose-phosphatase [Pontibacter burrus]|uniref:Trehalose 6-phosphate phosphatase n=1 Tax=Pontibacter burrus TaxID=2704466 RepID=A0A6B3LWP9_9BACT|nr:trehalose-phosphatase [Pontibacter burrus]NEM97907.1 trehalose-phosphatase [Pontibacter burrus]
MTLRSGTEVKLSDPATLPHALEAFDTILQNRKPAVFLDYDGCLTPIVQRPEQAVLAEEMRDTLQKLAKVCFVAIVSGRDRANVQQLVKLDELYFAGSHGFDISGPGNLHTEPGGATEVLSALDAAEQELKSESQTIAGVLVERKRYAIAVHYRNVPDGQVEQVKEITRTILARHPQLKKGLGKMVLELKPNLDWHKGKAVLWLLQHFNLDSAEVLPIYIGDDITDEDAFASLQGRGIGILVGRHDENTAANCRLNDVAEVQQLLEKLSKFRS